MCSSDLFLPLSSALAVKSLFCPPFLTIRTLSFGSLTYLQYNKYFCRAQSFIEYFDGFFQRACRRFCTSVLNIKKDAENIAFSCILANGGCQTSGRNSKRDRNFAAGSTMACNLGRLASLPSSNKYDHVRYIVRRTLLLPFCIYRRTPLKNCNLLLS